ncbi:hypothetical protein [Pseudomonas sp. DSP3-2-2]|uniref:hypothetical protein n=1 Tax=unclassified Pseudomonas TaxID=196821 RepID=UPI003CF4AD3F
MFTKTFTEPGTFQALYAAQKWLDENGYSYGPGSAMHPVPVLKGDFIIAKWKNLTRKEIAQLDGKIDGNFREGPVTVTLNVEPEGFARLATAARIPGLTAFIGPGTV